ncbi:hypothetical protein Mapa_007503 [Marchantia paleacea]|nr:hypothetical protein Mapa_007503 [Marchantia paleacea]
MFLATYAMSVFYTATGLQLDTGNDFWSGGIQCRWNPLVTRQNAKNSTILGVLV